MMNVGRGPKSFDDLRRKSKARREKVSADFASAPTGKAGRNDLAPRLELIDRSLDQLKMPARRARKSEAAQVARIRKNIEKLGFCRPVLIGPDNEIVDGVTTLEALRQLGQTTVQCIVVGHLTQMELRLLRISINRIPEQGAWDFDALKLEFEEMALEEAPIDVSGFSLPEIDQIMMEENPGACEVGDLEPKEGALAVTQLGAVVILGQHRLICGDARDPKTLQRLMHNRKARLVLTDEPFNVRVKGHVTGGDHREFAMAAGEMSGEQFLQFNVDWIGTALAHVMGTRTGRA